MHTSRVVVPAAEEIIDRYFPVLDHGFVALKDYMGSDLAIEEAARASYGRGTRTVSETRTLLRFLYRHGHATPFEMASVKLHIGLPITVMRQLVRQRTAKLNEYSGRYSEMPLLFFQADRDRVRKQSEQNKQGSSDLPLDDHEWADYEDAREEVLHAAIRHYRNATHHGVAREVARNELPLSTYTYLYWKIDMRNMFNLLSKRLEPDAQEEYRAYAAIFAGIARRACPLAFEAFQDYEQGAVTFSQAEMKALPLAFSGLCHEREPSPAVRQHVNTVLDAYGIAFTKSGRESREQREFWAKLKPKPRQDFTLDPAAARDASYYEQLIKDNA
jgi:thymidylate synthase (FAD)